MKSIIEKKNLMRYHFTLVRWLLSRRKMTNANKDMEQREPSYTAGGHVNWYIHYGK